MFETEVVGLDLLRELGQALFGDGDPTDVFYRGRPYRVEREDGRYVVSLELPFTSREDVSLSRRADELMLQVGGWRRTLVLPHALVSAQAEGAKMVDNTLKVYFASRKAAGLRASRGNGGAGR
jgi:arsenite-transporting ATPase